MEVAMTVIFPLGPSGGVGGGFFNDIDDTLGGFGGPGFTASIVQLQVNHGASVDHLQVSYRSGGTTFPPVQHGASNGGAQSFFDIQIDAGQRLVTVGGFIHVFNGTTQVGGLQFTTLDPQGNVQTSGLLGVQEGQGFVFDASPFGGEIMAFWGRQGLFCDALGVFVRV
jgi:hypothetical protein